jgi:hypothetical protein
LVLSENFKRCIYMKVSEAERMLGDLYLT